MFNREEELATEFFYENDAESLERKTNQEAYEHEIYIENMLFLRDLHAGKIPHNNPKEALPDVEEFTPF